jgi:hypothetical protein
MKLTLVTFAGICIVAIVPRVQAQRSPCASALGTVMTDSAALAFENAWATAAAAHDTRALGCMLADDFIDTNWQGTLRTKRDVLATGPVTPAGLKQHFSDWQVDRQGSTAIVRGLNTITDANNRTVSTLRFTDVLRYADGRWQAIAAQETMKR